MHICLLCGATHPKVLGYCGKRPEAKRCRCICFFFLFIWFAFVIFFFKPAENMTFYDFGKGTRSTRLGVPLHRSLRLTPWFEMGESEGRDIYRFLFWAFFKCSPNLIASCNISLHVACKNKSSNYFWQQVDVLTFWSFSSFPKSRQTMFVGGSPSPHCMGTSIY